MNRFVTPAALFVLIMSVALVSVPADAQHFTCRNWLSDSTHSGIDLLICVYDGGGSGFNRWRNRYDRDARIGFRFEFFDNTSYEASSPIPRFGESPDASCWGCAPRNTYGGIRTWRITQFALRGDPGFF